MFFFVKLRDFFVQLCVIAITRSCTKEAQSRTYGTQRKIEVLKEIINNKTDS
jgi:hypothetical protein